MLLFEFPEWSEDLADWKREVHVNCSYDGVPVTQEEVKEKDSINTNGTIQKLSTKIESRDWTNYSPAERKMKDLTDKRNTILNQINKINQIKKITKEKKKGYNAKSFNLKSLKRILQLLKIRNARLVLKSRFVIKLWIEKIYIDIFLGIMNITRVTAHLFLQSARKIFSKFIFNNEKNRKRLAYVLYKLSKMDVLNLYKLRSVLQNSGMNQWKNWLRNHYQYKYHLSKHQWDKLISQKRGNRSNQCSRVQNKVFRHDLLSYKSLNYEDNSNMEKRNFIDTFPINNYVAEDIRFDFDFDSEFDFDFKLGMWERPKRKYLHWKILPSIPQHQEGTPSNEQKKLLANEQKKLLANEQKKLLDWAGMNDERVTFSNSNLELWFFQKVVIFSKVYKTNPSIIPINLLLNLKAKKNDNLKAKKNDNEKEKKTDNEKENKNDNEKDNENKNDNEKEKKTDNEKENKNDNEKEKKNLKENKNDNEKDNENKNDNEKDNENKNDNEKDNKKKKEKEKKTHLELHLEKYLRAQVRWEGSVNETLMTTLQLGSLLLKMSNTRGVTISYIKRKQLNMDLLLIKLGFTVPELLEQGILIIEPGYLSLQNQGKLIMYRTINVLLVHQNKQKIYQKYKKNNQRYKKNNSFNNKKTKFPESSERGQSLIENIEKKDYDLLVPENILSPKRRRELRILMSFNSKLKKTNAIHRNIEILNDKTLKHGSHVFELFERKKRGGTNLKFFLWPNYRLEDLACMNRYWFDTNNGSRFSMVRIRIYPRLKSR
ncbi:Protein TIC 214 [Linum grandiflorum]